ncbi:MAG: FtsL-like putative cell division protein [Bacteroidota bacterium]
MKPQNDRTPAEPSPSARPMVYGGTMPAPPDQPSSPGSVAMPRNRKITTRTVSTFYIILLLFGAAAVIVLYISNIIAVDHLMMEINNLQKQNQRLMSEQEILKAEINRLSSLERVNRIAAEELGLVNPKEPPVWMSVDPERVRAVEEALQKK